MKNLIAVVLTALSLIWCNSAFAQKQLYACLITDASGFNINKNSQKYARSGFHSSRFTMSFDGHTARVKIAGDEEEPFYCHSLKPDLFQCTGLAFTTILFDRKALRFTRALMYGYVDDSTGSLVISYGDCQTF